MKTKLFDNYYFEIIDDADLYFDYVSEHRSQNFELDINYWPSQFYSTEEQLKLELLQLKCENRFTLRIFVYENNQIIGWCHGFQIENDTFYMTNSAINEPFRNKGIYSQLLKQVIEILREKGFQKITSRHKSNNNQVIIPKLKAGFVISSFEISEIFGILIQLTYFFNTTTKKVFDFRIGVKDSENEISKMLLAKGKEKN